MFVWAKVAEKHLAGPLPSSVPPGGKLIRPSMDFSLNVVDAGG